MEIQEIEKIADLLQSSTLTRVGITGENWSLELERDPPAVFAITEPATALQSEPPTVLHAPDEPIASSPDLTFVEAPVVGVFHEPGKPALVGQLVQTGEILGSIEAMTLRNEIRSPVDGEITAIQVEDGQPVEYGQTLFTIARFGVE